MAEVTITLPKKDTLKILKKLDKSEEYDDPDSYWIKENRHVEEMYLENYGSPSLELSFPGEDDEISCFISIPFGEMMKHFARFDFFGTLKKYIEDNHERLSKDIKLMRELKKFLRSV